MIDVRKLTTIAGGVLVGYGLSKAADFIQKKVIPGVAPDLVALGTGMAAFALHEKVPIEYRDMVAIGGGVLAVTKAIDLVLSRFTSAAPVRTAPIKVAATVTPKAVSEYPDKGLVIID
ncbi:hypothetical protein J7K27_02965 [Candidatus Bathyarchaeota archaeon]|nr:hypothetical protein [Candidatus Bathyarchaeota archaeon]